MVLGLDGPTSGHATVGGRRYQDLRFPLREVGALLDANAGNPGRTAANRLRWLAVLPLLVATGYASSRVDPTRTTVLPPGPHRTDAVDDVRLSRADSTVTVPNGRDLAASGAAPEPTGWRIDIERADPTDTPLCRATVDHGGVATSSTRSRRWTHEGTPHHHAIDPATGEQSATDLAAVTVFATGGWQAEAFATATLLAGSDKVIAFLASHDLSGLALADDGRVLRTDDLAELQVLSEGDLP